MPPLPSSRSMTYRSARAACNSGGAETFDMREHSESRVEQPPGCPTRARTKPTASEALLTRPAASHSAPPEHLRLGQRVELRLLRRRQGIADRRVPLVRFSLKPFHLGAHAVELRALLGRGLLTGCETAPRGLHLLPDRLPAHGGVFHHAVQRGICGRHLGTLIGSQAEGLAQRIDRHPVIRGWLEPTWAAGIGVALRCLREQRSRENTGKDGNGRETTHMRSR